MVDDQQLIDCLRLPSALANVSERSLRVRAGEIMLGEP
jgi:hypothetical protein